jgi:hypothetical protein
VPAMTMKEFLISLLKTSRSIKTWLIAEIFHCAAPCPVVLQEKLVIVAAIIEQQGYCQSYCGVSHDHLSPHSPMYSHLFCHCNSYYSSYYSCLGHCLYHCSYYSCNIPYSHSFIAIHFAASNATTDATTPADDTSISIHTHTDVVERTTTVCLLFPFI